MSYSRIFVKLLSIMATIFSKNSIVFAHSMQAQMWLIIIKINIYFTLKKFAAFNIFDYSTNTIF